MDRNAFKTARDLEMEGFVTFKNFRGNQTKVPALKITNNGVSINTAGKRILNADYVEIQFNEKEKLMLITARSKKSINTFKLSDSFKVGGVSLHAKTMSIIGGKENQRFKFDAELEKGFPLPSDTSLIIDLNKAEQF